MFHRHPIQAAEAARRDDWDWPLVVLGALILAGCLLRLIDPFYHNPAFHLFSDPLRHWDNARMPLAPSPMALLDPPFFQVWLSIVQKWTLGHPTLIAIYAATMSLVTPWLWYRFLREMLTSRRLAMLGWALFAWLPSWFDIFGYFMTETLFLPLLGASLWATARAHRKKTTASFCVMAVLWIFTALTRGIAAPIAAVAGLLVWYRHPLKWRAGVGAMLIAVIILGPLAYRNQTTFGFWSPFGSGWLNEIYAASGKREINLKFRWGTGSWTYGFRSPSVSYRQFEPLTDWSPEREGAVEVSVDLQQGARDWLAAARLTRAAPEDLLRFRLENLALVMAGETWPDSNQRHWTARLASSLRWIWAPLFVALVIVGTLNWRATLARPLVPAVIATWFCVQAVSLLAINEGRYRKPLEGLLIVQTLIVMDVLRRRPASLAPQRHRI